jgi:hypothetical protein
LTKLQKIVLTIVLVIDLALLLYPPLTIGIGYRSRNIGHHMLFSRAGNIDFVTLAAEVTIVSMVGLIVFLLAKAFSSE